MKARDVFQAILSDMVQLFQAVSVYPESHQYVREPLARLHQRLQEEARRLGTLSIGFLGDQVVIDQIPFLATTTGVRRLIRKMSARGIDKVEIREGIDVEELKRFIHLVSCAPPDAPEGEWRSLVFGRITGLGEAVPVDPTPSLAPMTAARSHPIRSERWRSS